ncbi:type IV pilin protein [Sporohalobacter salinus]|uniref:type IV pilin protein n=1 Tax=Sporohalobacter salinus TaxID=1494606 RepID=UPI001EF8E071|nr:prepilin-type N-terminal cleavage/methylation domain-containing protein [Sporohalobacter salinus]MBM7622731.1 prepilin-type N-terminal cleavage/methylation domain-containing protein [Sporohalobacter salinus]
MISKLRRKMSFINDEDGFTLIELMIVIGILGVLIAIAVPKFSGMTDEAEDVAVQSDLRNIQTGMSMHFAENTTMTALSDITDYVDFNLSAYSLDSPPTTVGGYQVNVTGSSFILTPGGIGK